MIAAVLSLGIGIAAYAEPPQPPTLTPGSVERLIAKFGARETVIKLTNANRGQSEFGDFDLVLSGVSSGDRGWLALAPRLKAGTDAATGLALTVSVAEALPKNPNAVLRLMKANPSWADVCSYPMIEPTKAEERRYFKDAIPAVKSVGDPALRSVRDGCLANLLKAQRTH